MTLEEVAAAHREIRAQIHITHPVEQGKGEATWKAEHVRREAYYAAIRDAGLPMPSNYCSELEERWERKARETEETTRGQQPPYEQHTIEYTRGAANRLP